MENSSNQYDHKTKTRRNNIVAVPLFVCVSAPYKAEARSRRENNARAHHHYSQTSPSDRLEINFIVLGWITLRLK